MGSGTGTYTGVFNSILFTYGCTVTTHIEGTSDSDGILLRTSDKHRYAFRIRTEDVKRLYRFQTGERVTFQIQDFFWIIIEVLPLRIIFQLGIIGIGIRAVATAIDIATDITEDCYCGATIDVARNIVTTIDIVDVATQYSHTGRIASWSLIGVIAWV